MTWRLVKIIERTDVGKIHVADDCPCCGHKRPIMVSGLMGRIRREDVGKAIFRDKDGNAQVENDEQRDKHHVDADVRINIERLRENHREALRKLDELEVSAMYQPVRRNPNA